MSHATASLPQTFGALRRDPKFSEERLARPVKQEIRDNLAAKLAAGETLFPGVHGFEDTVVPQIVNALLARHDFILLGLRGQAKSRILRALTGFLEPALPYLADSEIRDNPYRPISKQGKEILAAQGDDARIEYLAPEDRYIEKLATPDVTIADMIGDIDPIQAAKAGRRLSDELTMHFGLLPRAHRGIFAVNELPDLMGKIQVGLFNILQEGDVQIKGFPVRLPLDLLMVFSANPEDYTARGKIVTPLKDRIGSEIRTHYPQAVEEGVRITAQEAWIDRTDGGTEVWMPEYIPEIVEQIAFAAREDSRVDRRSGVSQRLPISVLEHVASNAERRALKAGEALAVPRVADIYAALPAITGKLELEYEGEMRGAETVALELIRTAVARVYDESGRKGLGKQIVNWFEMGGSLKLEADQSAAQMLKEFNKIQGLMELAGEIAPEGRDEPEILASAAEYVLDGLYAHRRLTRSEELGYHAQPQRPKKSKRRQQFESQDFGETYN